MSLGGTLFPVMLRACLLCPTTFMSQTLETDPFTQLLPEFPALTTPIFSAAAPHHTVVNQITHYCPHQSGRGHAAFLSTNYMQLMQCSSG